MKRLLIISFVFAAMVSSVFAQEPAKPAPRTTIFDRLNDNSSSDQGITIIHQDERILTLISDKKEHSNSNRSTSTTNGYRIQIFSSNEQRTAKAQAYNIGEKIKEQFPDFSVYVTYASPFWKVRVGDCISQEEAQILRADIQKAFPNQREIYIVKDRVIVLE